MDLIEVTGSMYETDCMFKREENQRGNNTIEWN